MSAMHGTAMTIAGDCMTSLMIVVRFLGLVVGGDVVREGKRV